MQSYLDKQTKIMINSFDFKEKDWAGEHMMKVVRRLNPENLQHFSQSQIICHALSTAASLARRHQFSIFIVGMASHFRLSESRDRH